MTPSGLQGLLPGCRHHRETVLYNYCKLRFPGDRT